MAKYVIDGETLKGIADEIRCWLQPYNIGDTKITPFDMSAYIGDVQGIGYDTGWDEGYAEGEDFGYTTGKTDGVADGKQQATNDFWDTFQTNLGDNYAYAFTGGGWSDATYNPIRPIVARGTANYMFAFNWITSTKVPITIDTDGEFNTHIFFTCYGLKTIPSIKVTEKVKTFQSWFFWCPELVEVNFTEDSVIGSSIAFAQSSKLTTASVNSIIHALKDLTGTTTQNLTFHATVGGKLTEEQKTAISAKNWTLVY